MLYQDRLGTYPDTQETLEGNVLCLLLQVPASGAPGRVLHGRCADARRSALGAPAAAGAAAVADQRGATEALVDVSRCEKRSFYLKEFPGENITMMNCQDRLGTHTGWNQRR